ncbi:MAG: c-type cytochrome [Gemmatimonadaceae bacterium]
MKWFKRIAVALLAVSVLGVGVVYALSSRLLNRRYAVPLGTVALPTDSASLTRGERMARIVGCHGCHGETLAGDVFFDEPRVARLVTSNIPEKVAAYTDAEFERLLRRGIRKDGTSPIVMPPPGLYHLSDTDVADVIAWIRSRPHPSPAAALPSEEVRIMGRFGLVIGQFKMATQAIDTSGGRIGNDSLYLTSRRGEYLARVVCTECHGSALQGDPTFPTPGLSKAVGYSLEQFTHLLRTGEPSGGPPLDLMAKTAKGRLHLLTDSEIAAIHAYIEALPATGIASGR